MYVDIASNICIMRPQQLVINGKCYFIYVMAHTWFKARELCRQMNADVAEFLNSADMHILYDKLYSLQPKMSFWIGLRKSTWFWSTG